jgi:putative ABC transport system permease protein
MITRQFPRLFFWHVVRNVRQHRILALLNVLSVGLGIAVYLAIQIANHSANQSFAAGIDLVAGKSHLEIQGDVDELLWPTVANQPGIRAVTAMIEGAVTLPDFPGEYLRIVGVDLFTSEPFRTFELTSGGESLDLEAWLGAGDAVAVTQEFAERLLLKPGDPLRVLVNSEVRSLRVLSLISPGESPAAAQSRFAVMDLGWAQQLLGKTGRVSSLQLLLDDPARGAAVAEQLQSILPPHLIAAPPRQRSFQVQTMLSAFQLNLTALSMVSLLVGVFLIYNTISASVARRRKDIGILRAIGASRLEVRCFFLGEACLFGAAGIAGGMLGGVMLAQVLSGAVAKTISSLYLLVSIDRTHLDPIHFLAAALFGVGAVLLGAWIPASEAGGTDPVRALSLGARAERSLQNIGRWTSVGAFFLLAAIGSAFVAIQVGPPAMSFVAAFLVLTGSALFSPGVTKFFADLAARFSRGNILWRLSAENLGRSIHRNSITVAALAAAVAMTTGLTVMIFSFRESVNAWIGRSIVADLFVAPSSNETIGLSASIPAATIEWLRKSPEVAGVDTFREISVPVQRKNAAARPALLAVVEGQYRENLTFVGGNEAARIERVFRAGCIAVSEPFARKFHVGQGDRVTLTTPRGPAEFEIAGVYSDYTRDQGVMLMEQGTFARWWDDPGAQSLAVYLRPAAAPNPLIERFNQQFSQRGEFAIYSNRSLRERILAIFDQTFAVTYVLRTVAIIVAIAGIFLSVTTLVTEREREIGALRAIGASRGQIQKLLMTEAGMIGAIAAGLGMLTGVALALVLTWVVNPAFFGWSIQLHWPWGALATTPLWIIAAALLAAWYPAWRESCTPIARAVRVE